MLEPPLGLTFLQQITTVVGIGVMLLLILALVFMDWS